MHTLVQADLVYSLRRICFINRDMCGDFGQKLLLTAFDSSHIQEEKYYAQRVRKAKDELESS